MIKLPSGANINNLIDDLRIFSWEASEILLHYSRQLKDSDFKRNFLSNNNPDNPVTLADLKVNEIIIRRIKKKYKDINWDILSEENVKLETNICLKDKDWLWILDPLDGTKDFIQGTGDYAMHLALNYRQKSHIGIVLIPEKDELWIANGAKTWCEKRDGTNLKFEMPNKQKLNEMTIVTSKNHRNQVLKNLIEKINFKKTIVMGSVGCKIASILRGESDLYISLSLPENSCPKDWDFAAPAAILKAAGGAITNLENEELSYNQSNYEQCGIIIASNNKNVHNDICLQLKEIIASNNIYPFN